MNERIRQLAEQSGLKIPADVEYNGHIYRHALEKFAASIVKECLLFTNPSPHEGTEFGSALAWADKNIREHFGVES